MGVDNQFLEGFRYPLIGGFVALLATLLFTPLVRKWAIAAGAVDDPTRDSRRVHTEPIPRWGGMGMYFGIVVALLVVLPFANTFQPFPPYLIGMLLLGGVVVAFGALDDLKQFSAKWQLLALLGVGLLVQVAYSSIGRVQVSGISLPFVDGDWIPFGWAAWPLTALYIFVVAKTMDTIDGVDGLAAGIAAIAAGTIAIIARYEDQPRVALIAAVIAGSCVGFLRYNFNPAKIFMGTGGAQLLGFLLACLSIVGALKTAAALALFIPILVFGVPLLDAALVTVRRLLAGDPITQADKRHLHHQLLARGLTQRQTVWVLYGVAILMAGVLLVMVRARG